MGIRCSCGVIVDAFSESNNVKFDGIRGTTTGNLTYLANVCEETLDTSTLSLTFTDTDGGTDRSFTFVVGPSFAGTEITSVECNQIGVNCEITVKGIGFKSGFGGDALLSFEAQFRDISVGTDNVQVFEISTFFDQNGAAPVPAGSIVNQGCSEA